MPDRKRMTRTTQAMWFAALALTAALPLVYGGSPAKADSIAGDYACRSMGPSRCDTNTLLRLLANGSWGWSQYSGHYRVGKGTVEFQGPAGWGPANWGPATIGPGTLTFTTGRQPVVWVK